MNKLLLVILISLISLSPIYAELSLGDAHPIDNAVVIGSITTTTTSISYNSTGIINNLSNEISARIGNDTANNNARIRNDSKKLNTTGSTANPNINGNITANSMVLNGDGTTNANSSLSFMEGGLNRFQFWYDGLNNLFKFYNSLFDKDIFTVQVATNEMIIYSNVTIQGGGLDVDGNITSGGKLVCLEDGTNCKAVGANVSIVNYTLTNAIAGLRASNATINARELADNSSLTQKTIALNNSLYAFSGVDNWVNSSGDMMPGIYNLTTNGGFQTPHGFKIKNGDTNSMLISITTAIGVALSTTTKYFYFLDDIRMGNVGYWNKTSGNMHIGTNNDGGQRLKVEGNVNITGYYYGDGSKLTNLPFTDNYINSSGDRATGNFNYSNKGNITNVVNIKAITIYSNGKLVLTTSDNQTASVAALRISNATANAGILALRVQNASNRARELSDNKTVTNSKMNKTGGTITGNLTVTGYINGQPISGSIGSGIIWAKNLTTRATLRVNYTDGLLRVTYPDFIVRLVKTDLTTTYCNISGATVTPPDNQQSSYYIDQNCAVQVDTTDNYIKKDISLGGITDFMEVMTHKGEVESLAGVSLLQKVEVKDKQLFLRAINLNIIGGFAIHPQSTFKKLYLDSGEYQFIRDIVKTSPVNLSKTGTEIEFVYHTGATTWNFADGTELNTTNCDTGTALAACSPTTKYRRHFIFMIGYNNSVDSSELHQLAPLQDRYYSTIAECLDTITNPLTYTLPDEYKYTAVMLYAYCARVTDSSWATGNFIDLRTVKQGATSGSTSPDLSSYMLKQAGSNLNMSNVYNITNSNVVWTTNLWANIVKAIGSITQMLFQSNINMTTTHNITNVNCMSFKSGGRICTG